MGNTLRVPKGYEKYKREYLKKLARGEVSEEKEKQDELFYVA